MQTQTINLGWWLKASEPGNPDVSMAATVRTTLPVGDADGEANQVFRMAASLAASASVTISLYELQNAYGGDVTMGEISAILCTVQTAGGKGKLEKGDTAGWTALGSTPVLPFDATFPLFFGSAAGFSVSNTDKNIKITNTGAATATFVLYILGRG